MRTAAAVRVYSGASFVEEGPCQQTRFSSTRGLNCIPAFAHSFNDFPGHSRYADGYDVAVRICRLDRAVAAGVSRVRAGSMRSLVSVRHAVRQRGKDSVDGKADATPLVGL